MALEVQVSKIRLDDARAELVLTQSELARLAGVAEGTVMNAEKGRIIRKVNAYAILNALNAVRQERGLPPLARADIDWNIQERDSSNKKRRDKPAN